MTSILVVSDDGVPTGYGRIAMEINQRLVRRGYTIHAASYAYDGLLMARNGQTHLPYHVAPLAGKPNWPDEVVKLINVLQPNIIVSIQDFPYAQTIRNLPLDWSRYGFIIVTPVDGAPIYPRWIDVMKQADAGLTISQFGVEQFKQQGVKVTLCRPGVDTDYFFRLTDEQRLAIRDKLGITPDAFVLGMCAQNQGRKDIPHVIEAFHRFALDKPDARLFLDMERVSPAGWDIPGMICEPNGFDMGKIIFREDAFRAGVIELRDRMNIMDAHCVLSHREGYGLPLVEAQACGVMTLALDYSSGTEICADGRGLTIAPIAYQSYSTWGGAMDKHPDMDDFVAKLERLYANPDERKAMSKKSMTWARKQTWDNAADALQTAIDAVMTKRTKEVQQLSAVFRPFHSPVPMSPDGINVDNKELASVSFKEDYRSRCLKHPTALRIRRTPQL